MSDALTGAVVYDTGALLAAERANPRIIKLHQQLGQHRIRPLVPVVVLAQAWRGGPQHRMSRLLRGCDIVPDDEQLGRTAGIACAAAGTSDVVDALVVVLAARIGALVVTSHPDDLLHLADALGLKLRVVVV